MRRIRNPLKIGTDVQKSDYELGRIRLKRIVTVTMMKINNLNNNKLNKYLDCNVIITATIKKKKFTCYASQNVINQTLINQNKAICERHELLFYHAVV